MIQGAEQKNESGFDIWQFRCLKVELFLVISYQHTSFAQPASLPACLPAGEWVGEWKNENRRRRRRRRRRLANANDNGAATRRDAAVVDDESFLKMLPREQRNRSLRQRA